MRLEATESGTTVEDSMTSPNEGAFIRPQPKCIARFLSAPVCPRDREDRVDYVRHVTIRQPGVER